MSEPVFSLTDVSYSYPGSVRAVNAVSLAIHPGERAAIIGANGTGKSTLLTLLDALIFAESGEVRALGKPVTSRSMNNAQWQREFRGTVGFVFQNPDVQLFCPTVKEDIVFGPLQLGVDRKEIRTRLDAIAANMHLTDLLERSPHHLSMGEKKKVAIASVLIIQPEVLLLDEPTAGLDPQTTRDIIAIIYQYHQAGKTVVFATHDLHIVEEIADTIHVFGKNRGIIRSGEPAEIIGDQAFLQEHNLAHIHVHRHLHGSHVHPHEHSAHA